MKLMDIALDLQLFDEGGAGAAAAGTGSAPAAGTDGQAAAEGKAEGNAKAAVTDEAKADADIQSRRDAFEARIKGDDKDVFQEVVDRIMADRLKNAKKQEAQLASIQTRAEKQQAVLDLLGSRYQNVDTTNPDALMEALEQDDAMWERYAEELGVPNEVARRLAKAERENETRRRNEKAAEERRQADNRLAMWHREGEALKQIFKNFDLQAEAQNPQTGERFVNLLRSGVPVRDAYQTIHMDELMQGTIKAAVQTTQKRMTDEIRANGMRADENGLNPGGAADAVFDVSKVTNAQLADFHKRAMAGEIVNPFKR